jgi:hypothetical protein
MEKLNSIEALEFWEGDYSRDAKYGVETSHGKINGFGLGNEVNSKSIKIRSTAERARR